MEAITSGMQGPAVEDVQARLTRLGYTIDAAELEAQEFGPATAKAVQEFRANMQLDAGDTVDTACWSALVDASYALGERTLYLRLPNFHGADVMELQHALNTLGFSCGRADGSFGPHTEAALQQFQENVGLFADGMAFQDTFNYIHRLRHVWEGKPPVVDAEERTGFARAASVLERNRIAVMGVDPIARNVASRMWNIATATTDGSGMQLWDVAKFEELRGITPAADVQGEFSYDLGASRRCRTARDHRAGRLPQCIAAHSYRTRRFHHAANAHSI